MDVPLPKTNPLLEKTMALKTQAALFRNIRLLQGGADAFAEITEPTSISPSSMIAWLIKRVEVMIPNSVEIGRAHV